MSILGMNGGSTSFHEFKKQASFFFKEKIKTARLALTDVTPAQLLAEEATDGIPGWPDAPTLKMISKAAFEVDDYWRIVDILHKRLGRFDRRDWMVSYKALIVVEHLLTHGPDRVAEEFQTDTDVITEMENFHHIDDKGFNWGLNVRKKSERILKLLEKGPVLKEERDKARKISREIQGFGSFCNRTSSGPKSSHKSLHRCNSEFTDREDFFVLPDENPTIKTETEKKPIHPTNSRRENSKIVREGSWNLSGESKALLGAQREELPMEDDHPFDESEHQTAISLLSAADEDELQAY